MHPSLKDLFNTLIAIMDQMDQRLREFKDQADANCKDLATRLDRLETNRRRIPDSLEENESRDNNRWSLRLR